jgi:Zn-dependent metalloprotease
MRHWRTAAALIGLAAMVVSSSSAQKPLSPPTERRQSVDDKEEPTGVSDPMNALLAAWRERSKTPVAFHAEDGRLRSASFLIPLPKATGDAAEDAISFLDQYADVLQLPKPRATLSLSRVARSEVGATAFFNQHFGGVGVYSGQIAVHMEKGAVNGVSGAWLQSFPPRMDPTLDEAEASARARADAGKGSAVAGAQLVHYDPGVIYSAAERAARKIDFGERLAWRVAIFGEGGWYYMIDAQTGAVLEKTSAVLDANTFEIVGGPGGRDNFANCSFLRSFPTSVTGFAPGVVWYTQRGAAQIQAGRPGPDAEATAAYSTFHNVMNEFRNRYGRDGMDGRGGFVRAGVSLATIQGLGGNNARYSPNCDDLGFTTNMTQLDIFAHEFAHGVTTKTANLALGNGQSGSLHEHYSDVFGAIFDSANWTFGEGSAAGTMRNLADPPSILINPNNPMSAGFPDRMANLALAPTFPHLNANIMNKAAYLIAQGQTFNNVAVRGIGRDKMGALYYLTLTTQLTANSNFQTVADRTRAVAGLMAQLGAGGFSTDDACQVSKAFTAVELDGDVDCDGTVDSADADRDNDGVGDATDNCRQTPNAGQGNRDQDALGDACDPDIDGDGRVNSGDNCIYDANANQADWNGDGYGDACSDSDFDRVSDALDNCRFKPNPDQRDNEGDGFGDACDVDSDNDGVCYGAPSSIVGDYPPGWPPGGCTTAVDNCPMTSNPLQTDGDGDGEGDACDRCAALANSGVDTDRDGVDNVCDTDDDADTIADAADNCPLVANMDQIDANQNGVGQACDPSEQINLTPSGRAYTESLFAGRNPFDRYSIPLGCAPKENDPWFGGRDEVAELTIESSTPMQFSVVNRLGQRLVTAPAGTKAILKLDFAAGLCPLLGYDNEKMTGADLLARLGAERYTLIAEPQNRTRELRMSIGAEIVDDPRSEKIADPR